MMVNNNWQRQLLLGIGLASLFITSSSSSSSSSSSLGIERCDNSSINFTINSLPFPTLVRLTEMTVPFNSSSSNWTLHRGENYSLKADFESVSAARQVHLRLYLLPANLTQTSTSIRLPFFRKDLCRTPGTGLHCPLLPSHSSFKLTVRIPVQTPPLQGRLRLLLLNERRRPLLCFIMPLRVAADDS